MFEDRGAILDPSHVVAIASNIRGIEHNPSYTKEDFETIYPYFKDRFPEEVIDMYIKMANSCLSYDRWQDQWKFGMGLYVAHFLTLYLQLSDGLDENSPAGQVISQSISRGLQSSKSVGDLSVGYDHSILLQDLDSWGQWKLTLYGQQFVGIAKLLGKAGIYVW